MSVEFDWERLLEDEEVISEKIRSFLDRQFQQLTLPPYIKSLSVTSFNLGTVAPEITIKHIADPFPEFYSDLFDDEEEQAVPNGHSADLGNNDLREMRNERSNSTTSSLPSYTTEDPNRPHEEHIELTPVEAFSLNGTMSPPLSPNGTAGLHYFHSPLSSTLLSSIRTPLYGPLHMSSLTSHHPVTPGLRPSLVEPSLSASVSSSSSSSSSSTRLNSTMSPNPEPQRASPRPGHEEDTQLFLEVKYMGNVQLGVTATLLLNYPSPNFISLPIKLKVTGFEISAMAVVAYISKRIHFSFICDIDGEGDEVTLLGKDRIDIIKNIKIESEIGDQSGNGPVLRNVGKVERFLLERLRALARDELAWPGWITLEF
ncbi:mitochondrial distribution and morphology protein 12 [Trichomonascus vanleenenianus]|uniref:ERMES complex subunit MDM12 n=1 Tax=Trichomonascus vanleenenianus TaxID=2268995 RepID=UPI003ECAED4D